MNDLISRDDVYNVLKKVNIREMPIYVFDKLWNGVRDLPSAEPEQTAKVERYSFGETLTYDFDGQCECGKWVDALWNYCPSCGAKLEWNELQKSN